ncbi:hypothetical protein CC77DRAFT_1052878 [Alternaria alternata]|uniref:Uncharacterized protein n=3 Tax=Alternaria alternata complex TaxID=187734 RepID=A0A177DDT1_ALTAL|nr:hypothetical protein CC77DRAFT_1052878 [Alternaria alternata]OAG17367.1 hypothetical protein CC77DRAFT_1052878 [Alternaria alternata]
MPNLTAVPQYKQSHLGLALYPSPHQGYRATFHLLLGIHSTTYIVYTVPYDRDVVVNCIKRHYDLLVRIAYLDPDVILHPPPGGWSDEQLAVDTLKERKRSERVIDLLRHMPYLSKNKDTVGKYEVYIETDACTYLRNHGWFKDEYRDPYGLMMPWNSEQDSPAGFIPLSMGNAATVWMVDTDEGIIWPMGPFIVTQGAPEDQPWRACAKPRDIQEYFDELYTEIETLVTVPVPKTKSDWRWYHEILSCREKDGAQVQRLLKEHGWPEALRKEEYLKALEEERYDAKRNEEKKREEKERRRKTRREIAVGKTYDLRSKSGKGGSTAS